MYSTKVLRRAGARSGPRPTFNRDDLIDAALEVGLATFTIGDVAKKVGVTSSAVYRVIATRDELVDAALARAINRIEWPLIGTDWAVGLHELVDVVWRACAAERGLALVALTNPSTVLRLGIPLRCLASQLEQQGFEPELAESAIYQAIGLPVVLQSSMEHICGDDRIPDSVHRYLDVIIVGLEATRTVSV